MRIYEIDWRYPWLRRILVALDTELGNIPGDFDDGTDMLEHADPVIGLGFVALQDYIGGTEADLKLHLSIATKEVQKFRSSKSVAVGSTKVTRIETIWAAGNHFKHKDEWINWAAGRPDSPSDGNRKVFDALGITEKTNFPCIEMLKRLSGDEWCLAGLLEECRVWRESCFSKATT